MIFLKNYLRKKCQKKMKDTHEEFIALKKSIDQALNAILKMALLTLRLRNGMTKGILFNQVTNMERKK